MNPTFHAPRYEYKVLTGVPLTKRRHPNAPQTEYIPHHSLDPAEVTAASLMGWEVIKPVEWGPSGLSRVFLRRKISVDSITVGDVAAATASVTDERLAEMIAADPAMSGLVAEATVQLSDAFRKSDKKTVAQYLSAMPKVSVRDVLVDAVYLSTRPSENPPLWAVRDTADSPQAGRSGDPGESSASAQIKSPPVPHEAPPAPKPAPAVQPAAQPPAPKVAPVPEASKTAPLIPAKPEPKPDPKPEAKTDPKADPKPQPPTDAKK